MSWSRLICGLLLAAAVAGCGFRPLYAPPQEDSSGDGVYAFRAFRSVVIGNIPERDGQYLRTRLERLLHPRGLDESPRYVLSVQLNESIVDLAVRKSAVATRANLTVTGRFSLRRFGESDREEVAGYTDEASSTSGFNTFQSEFQTLIAEQGARERALDDLAHQIRIRLASHLTTIDTQSGQ